MNTYTTDTPTVGYALIAVLVIVAFVTLALVARFFSLRSRAARQDRALGEAKRLLARAMRPTGNFMSTAARFSDRMDYRTFVLVDSREDLSAALWRLKDPAARRALPEDDPDRKIADLVFGDETVP
jgi:hypothetical protein